MSEDLAGHAMLPTVSFLARLRAGSPGHHRPLVNGSFPAAHLGDRVTSLLRD